MASLWDYISPTGEGSQARSNWLRENVDQPISEAARYYLGAGTGVPNLLGLLADGTPSSGLGRASQASQQLFAPDQSIMDRITSTGNLLSETAGVGAGLLGVNQTARAVGPAVEDATRAFGRNVAERLNQRGPMPTLGSNGGNMFDVVRKDASEIFGQGSERVRYTDPKTGATTEVVVRPDGSASVLDLEVPEASRGKGIGQNMQERIMQDYPMMGGQVSSKAAAKTAYRLGRRPVGKPDATLDDVFAEIDDMSSVNMVSPAMQERFAKKLPAARTEQEIMAKQILEFRAANRIDEVTPEMMQFAESHPSGSAYLYKNTPLPMDEASRMQRAADLEYDANWYHGSQGDINKFDRSTRGTWLSDNPDLSDSYIAREGGSIYPVMVRGGGDYPAVEAGGMNYNRIPASGLPDDLEYIKYGDEGNKPLNTDYIVSRSGEARPRLGGVLFNDLIDRGPNFKQYAGETVEEANARATRASQPSKVMNVANPKSIRSKFARFDPAFKDLPNLTAAIPVGLLGLSEYENQKDMPITKGYSPESISANVAPSTARKAKKKAKK